MVVRKVIFPDCEPGNAVPDTLAGMSATLLAIIFKPLVALVLFGLICLPVRLAVICWFPEGRIKNLLLLRIRKDRLY
jgi:hypothetical protein